MTEVRVEVRGAVRELFRSDDPLVCVSGPAGTGTGKLSGALCYTGGMTTRTCSIDGCEKKHYGRGYCQKHHFRWRKHGDPLVTKNPIGVPAVERFHSFVEKTDTCWVWLGHKNKDGYGYFWTGSRDALAHRYSYETFVGDIPEGLTIDHLCKVRDCVRPDHLEPVTLSENIRRAGAPQLYEKKTHCKHGHEFTEENTRICKDGSRECKTCRRETKRRYRERHRR